MSRTRIAIPKGRLQPHVLGLFAAAGYDTPSESDLRSRRLVFDRDDVQWIFVKDVDVPVYVEHGAADAGVAGRDQIDEQNSTAYQPLDLPFGRCRIMLIGAPGTSSLTASSVRSVATKYPRIARRYLQQNGLHAEVVTLGGSVELAAVLGLTTHVIDLVETGETVRVHGLALLDLVLEVSPRLIVGRDAYRRGTPVIRNLIARVSEAAKEPALSSRTEAN